VGITVRYKGIEGAPLLVTASGVHPSKAPGPQAPPAEVQVFGNPGELRQSLRRQEQERVLAEVYRRVDGLAQSLERLQSPDTRPVSRDLAAVSSQPSALGATPDQEASLPAVHTLEVAHPARPRTVLSAPQNPIAPVELADGEHSILLTVDGQETTVSFQVNNSAEGVDTQEDLLRRLARALDSRDSRLAARVVYGERDAYDPAPRSQPRERTVRLELTAAGQGRGVDFHLADAEGETLARDYRLDAAPPPRSAKVWVEGAWRQQDANRVSLDGGHLTAEIADSTVGPARVEVRPAAELLAEELAGVIGQYNELVRYVGAHADLLRPSLQDRLTRPLEDRARLMPPLDLRPTPQGRLEMGEGFGQRLVAAFDQAREALLGHEGWTGALAGKLEQIRRIEPREFAAELIPASPAQASRQAWDLVGSLSVRLIDGYY
jgi:hypothetical protein